MSGLWDSSEFGDGTLELIDDANDSPSHATQGLDTDEFGAEGDPNACGPYHIHLSTRRPHESESRDDCLVLDGSDEAHLEAHDVYVLCNALDGDPVKDCEWRVYDRMLVDVRQTLEYGKWVLLGKGQRIRLQRLDACQMVGSEGSAAPVSGAFLVPSDPRFISGSVNIDREVRTVGPRAMEVGELVGQMVERRPKLLDRFARDDAEVDWWGAKHLNSKQMAILIRVVWSGDFNVFVRGSNPDAASIEFFEVIRPALDLGPDSLKSIFHE